MYYKKLLQLFAAAFLCNSSDIACAVCESYLHFKGKMDMIDTLGCIWQRTLSDREDFLPTADK